MCLLQLQHLENKHNIFAELSTSSYMDLLACCVDGSAADLTSNADAAAKHAYLLKHCQ
jgi:hypothetical protein